MRKFRSIPYAFAIFCALAACLPVSGQATVSEEITGFYSFGIANEDQILPDDIPGGYSEQKNGYFVDGKISIRAAIDFRFDLFLQLSTRSRTGGPYLGLQLGPSSEAPGFSIGLDSAFVRLNILDGLQLINPPLDLYIKAGRYSISAANLRTGRYGLENATGMVKTANVSSVSLELTKVFEEIGQFYLGQSSSLSLELASAGLFEEAVQRLYDEDGGISQHGKVVVGEYTPQLFAALRLKNYVLPFGILSLDGSYALNGASIYSGHSAGISAKLLTILKPNELFLPVSLSAAYFEKNLDVLAGAAGNGIADDTTDFRGTFRTGLSAGVQYQTPYSTNPADALRTRIEADVTLAAAFTSIQHLYRDPLSILSAGLDGRVTINRGLFAGGGILLGTLGEVTWQTAEDVSAVDDDYSHTFTLAQNLGFEVYTGINVSNSARIALGVAKTRGLSMGYGLEAVRDGMVKYRQPGSAVADELFESFGVYLLLSGRL